MAIEESTDIAHNGSGFVAVPVLKQRHRKAPITDPYLRADTLTTDHVEVCGYQLPPILSGVQPCRGKEYDVTVVWMSRRQIEEMMRAVAQQHPDLREMLEVMRAFMCHLDTLRDEVKSDISASMGLIKRALPADSPAISNLQGAVERLGSWNDEHRLPLH